MLGNQTVRVFAFMLIKVSSVFILCQSHKQKPESLSLRERRSGSIFTAETLLKQRKRTLSIANVSKSTSAREELAVFVEGNLQNGK
jgi:hypothetical protein